MFVTHKVQLCSGGSSGRVVVEGLLAGCLPQPEFSIPLLKKRSLNKMEAPSHNISYSVLCW